MSPDQHFPLAAVPADAREGDPGDAGPEEGGLDVGESLGTDDRTDELHGAWLAEGGAWPDRLS